MDREFCIDYILDECLDCPERKKDIKCQTESNCYKVKKKIMTDLRKLDKIEQIIKDSGNFKGECTAHDKYVKIAEIILEKDLSYGK